MNDSVATTVTGAAQVPLFQADLREFHLDPYATYERLRRDTPIVRLRKPLMGEAFYLSRYDDVLTVLKDDRFANDARNAGGRESRLMNWLSFDLNNTMVMRDGLDHRRLRNLVHMAFTPGRVEALRGRIDAMVLQMLERAVARGDVELIADLALPLPITVICDLMGVPEKDRAAFRRWMSGLLDFEGGGFGGLIRNVPRMLALFRFLRGQISARRKERGDDLLSAMIAAEEDGQKLSFNELVASTFLLLLAGHETTVNLIGNGMLALLDNPEQWERLRADRSLLDPAIEELLRFSNPVQMPAPRYVREELELCGARLPRGSMVVPMVASANRDERRFPNADALDIGRTPNKHVAFGFGAHYCVGAPLARMEARAVFVALLDRFPHPKLAIPRERIQWRKSMSLRGLQALPMTLA